MNNATPNNGQNQRGMSRFDRQIDEAIDDYLAAVSDEDLAVRRAAAVEAANPVVPPVEPPVAPPVEPPMEPPEEDKTDDNSGAETETPADEPNKQAGEGTQEPVTEEDKTDDTSGAETETLGHQATE